MDAYMWLLVFFLAWHILSSIVAVYLCGIQYVQTWKRSHAWFHVVEAMLWIIVIIMLFGGFYG